MMYIFLHDNAEVPSHIGRALFSGARLRDAMSFIRRLHESKNQMLSADIADLFSQLGAINTMRDHVVHWGAMEADDGTMITSNRLFSHAQRSLQEFPVSPEVLDTMTTDCDKAVAMLLIRQREFEEENTFTPVPKVELHQRKLAQLPWRYKSVQAIRQARKSQPMRGKPPTGPKPSRA